MLHRLSCYSMILGLAALCACGGSPELQSPASEVERVWKENEQILERAIEGSGASEQEFERACDFFERLTDVRIHFNASPFGVGPARETGQDLVELRRWYAANKARLYWDQETETVKIRETQNPEENQ